MARQIMVHMQVQYVSVIIEIVRYVYSLIYIDPD